MDPMVGRSVNGHSIFRKCYFIQCKKVSIFETKNPKPKPETETQKTRNFSRLETRNRDFRTALVCTIIVRFYYIDNNGNSNHTVIPIIKCPNAIFVFLLCSLFVAFFNSHVYKLHFSPCKT